VDIHRERSRGAKRVEDIEVYASSVEQELVSFEDTPENAMETGEKKIVIRRAIDNLPTRLRETFILHFYRELSYQEIAQQQEISSACCLQAHLAGAGNSPQGVEGIFYRGGWD
jgi:RNA polymerase sigma-70 factor (ECF subfamily)